MIHSLWSFKTNWPMLAEWPLYCIKFPAWCRTKSLIWQSALLVMRERPLYFSHFSWRNELYMLKGYIINTILVLLPMKTYIAQAGPTLNHDVVWVVCTGTSHLLYVLQIYHMPVLNKWNHCVYIKQVTRCQKGSVTLALLRPYNICHTWGSNSQPHYNIDHYRSLHSLSQVSPLA